MGGDQSRARDWIALESCSELSRPYGTRGKRTGLPRTEVLGYCQRSLRDQRIGVRVPADRGSGSGARSAFRTCKSFGGGLLKRVAWGASPRAELKVQVEGREEAS